MNDKMMRGSNTLVLCMAEMKVAVQEYIDKRLGEFAPRVNTIKADQASWTFSVELSDKEEK